MSNPKEKAQELVDKLTLTSNAQDGSWMCKDLAKQCALIAVNEILDVCKTYLSPYYNEVKKEIEKL